MPLDNSPRAMRLRDAEARFLSAGGIVLRLAGLYDAGRGPHNVYLGSRESPLRPDGLISLIHYDDAARLCTVALQRGRRSSIYLGCDDEPVARQVLAQSAARSFRFGGANACRFTGSEGPIGRHCDNTWTRMRLGWTPIYRSFNAWLASGEA